jgi:hypothetical protein
MPSWPFRYTTPAGEVVYATEPMSDADLADWDGFIAQAPTESSPELWELI